MGVAADSPFPPASGLLFMQGLALDRASRSYPCVDGACGSPCTCSGCAVAGSACATDSCKDGMKGEVARVTALGFQHALEAAVLLSCASVLSAAESGGSVREDGSGATGWPLQARQALCARMCLCMHVHVCKSVCGMCSCMRVNVCKCVCVCARA